MKTPPSYTLYVVSLALGLVLSWQSATANVLDENCVVNILNRTVQVNKNGSWIMDNLPTGLGKIRARATCIKLGDTFSGASDYFQLVKRGDVAEITDILFENVEPTPVKLQVAEPVDGTINSQGAVVGLKVLATYRDGTTLDVTASDKGTNYTSSNPAIASVDENGLVKGITSGSVLITVRKDEVAAFKRINVATHGDSDNDGLPDDFELANGLNPNDPLDAQEDPDQDGLASQREYQLGTGIKIADSDGDGIRDGVEVSASNGYTTDPLKADTDGDGVNDNDEILAGYNPIDKNDSGGRGFVELVVTPSAPTMTYNTIYKESNLQVKVSGKRKDGSLVDLTSRSTGTSYSSDDLSVLNFGGKDGLLFAGQPGNANLTVKNGGLEKTVPVAVGTFNPRALSAIDIPGYANNVDVAVNYAYVAAGSNGLHVVDVTDHANPIIVASLDTPGIAIDVRVVGNMVYLADGDHGLQIIDVSSPANPRLIASYETAGFAQNVKVDGQFAYIAGYEGLEIVDVSKPARPLPAGSLKGIGEARGVDAQGNTAVVVTGTSLHVIDVTDKSNPVKTGSLGIGSVMDVALKDSYAYVSAYLSGWQVVDISIPGNPYVVARNTTFVPRDMELTDGFAFAAEQLFPNVTAYVNIGDPTNAVSQGTIDLASFGSNSQATGIALDSNYVYLTGGLSGSNGRLFIAQYRLVEDKGGVPPVIQLTEPVGEDVIVEGDKVTVTVSADDDIGVKSVSFLINGQVAYTDTSMPYQYPMDIPFETSGSIDITATATDFGGNIATTSLILMVQIDTDRDGLSDSQEVVYGSNPNSPDTDGDTVNDGDEVDLKTNPANPDTDDDGIGDGIEMSDGTDPLNPDVTPPTVLSTTPRNEAIDIPENNPIIVTFNEPLSAKSINAKTSSMVVYEGMLEGAATVAGKVNLSSDGLQLIFTPNGELADFTDYKVIIGNIRDRAGNLINNTYTFHYKTGNTIDTSHPTVMDISPNDNALNVPPNAVIGVRFSEPVKAESVNEQSVLVDDQATNQPILGSVTLSGDGKSLIFVPDTAFSVGRRHHIFVGDGITDLSGNTLYSGHYYFTTSFNKDAAGPKIVGFSVADNQVSVPTNARLQIQFDEPVSGLSLDKISLYKNTDTVAVTRELSDDRKTLTLRHAQPLSPNTSYRIHVEAVEDLSGNVQANTAEHPFTTGSGADLVMPQIVGYEPNIEYVGLNSRVAVSFSEKINPMSLVGDAFYLSTNSRRIPSKLVLSTDGKTATLIPDMPLESNQGYSVNLSAPLSDQAGNGVSGSSWQFSTGSVVDLENPLILGSNIDDGAKDIPTNAQLRFVLDEPVSRLSTDGSVRLIYNDNNIYGTVTLGSDNRTLTFIPSTALAINTNYTVVVDGLYDYIGNKLAPVTTHFSTGDSDIADTVAPTVTVTPIQTDNVSANTPITFLFSETIDPTTLDTGISITSDAFTGTIAGNFIRNGNSVVFTPLSPFPKNSVIWVTINDVLDLAGNRMNFMDHFVTGINDGDITAPELVSITPNDGSLDVNSNNPIVLTFSESLNQSTVNSHSIGLFTNGEIISPAGMIFSGDNRTVTLTNPGLPPSSIVSVILTNDIKDLSGNRLADTIKVFGTATAKDSTWPGIVTVFPGYGAYNVLPKNKIVLYSNNPLDNASIQNSLHISQNGVLVDGTREIIGDGRTVVFTSAQPWNKDALIEIFLENTAKDVFGNALEFFSSSFRTEEDSRQKAPYVIAKNIDDYGYTTNGMPLNPVVDLLFNEPLDSSTVSSSTVVLNDSIDGVEVPTSVKLIKNGRVVRLTPTKLLTANHSYYISIHDGLKDMDGTESPTVPDYTWQFVTGMDEDVVAPQITSLIPDTTTNNIGINSLVFMRFDEPVSPMSFLTGDTDQPIAQLREYDRGPYYSLAFTDHNRICSYVPHEPWPINSDVTIAVSSPEDFSGHSIPKFSQIFHTGNGPDINRPYVQEWSIAENAINVPVNSVFKVRFNEPLSPISNSIFSIKDTTLEYQDIPASLNFSSDGRTLTLVPEEVLVAGHEYQLRVASNLGQDVSGNGVDGYHRFFTTAKTADFSPPEVTGFSIVPEQTGVPTNNLLQIQFSEAVGWICPELNCIKGQKTFLSPES